MTDYLRSLFDERHELAGWALLGLTIYAIVWQVSLDWPHIALALLCALTLLGASRYRGMELGPVQIGSAARGEGGRK